MLSARTRKEVALLETIVKLKYFVFRFTPDNKFEMIVALLLQIGLEVGPQYVPYNNLKRS